MGRELRPKAGDHQFSQKWTSFFFPPKVQWQPSRVSLRKLGRSKNFLDLFSFLVSTLWGSDPKINGSTPDACWDKIYRKIRKMQDGNSNGFGAESGGERKLKSGSDMFGFSNPEVIKLLKGLSKSIHSSKLSTSKLTSERYQGIPVGYRPVRVDWKDLDKCNVCHMDEEYENNLFLQCDKCRMMSRPQVNQNLMSAQVHARCYGELEPVDGVLWLCNLCRPGAPNSPPPCCLCLLLVVL
ncbi:hypothetical protein NC651_007285 [Populus alba x Populus x berolinensis]|nr:hypothetical protein NC651_007285 [Populus alba x Populus x berolinensis]